MVSKKDCDFIVLKEKREVICVLQHTRYKFLNYIDRDNLLFTTWNDKLNDKLFMPDYFIGVATCNATDKWDEQLGKDIAYSKALNKFNRSFFKRAQTYIDAVEKHLDDTYTDFNAYGAKLEKCEVDRAKWLEERIEPNT